MKKKNKKYTNQINKELMPIADEIKSKMETLEKKFNFNIDFAFKEITMEDIMHNV